MAWSRVVAVEIEIGGFAVSSEDESIRLAAGLDTGSKGKKGVRMTHKWVNGGPPLSNRLW